MHEANHWTVTDKGLEAARIVRRLAAQDNQYWNSMKGVLGKYAKEQIKLAQRLEKACTIWLKHFEDEGKKSIKDFPSELKEELDCVWREMVLA